MKGLSIFHELPYWSQLQINHLLDPMHIFKNVGYLIWEHLIGQRDTLRAQKDLKDMGRMEYLWPKMDGNRVLLPKAPWVLIKREEEIIKKEIASFHTLTNLMHFLNRAFTWDRSTHVKGK